ncbi:MAG TPA: response regulator [Polyangiales bacterium]|nr:response regulator [Polyangiales bacterium]
MGRRILVVDDDLAMLWFFSGVVRDAGGEALQSRDGADGLDTARRKRPQLVLSDILMPKLDGFGLRRALARDLWLERTPVLLLSWKGDPADTEARAPNASGLLQKTASVPEVLAAIERALAPRKQLEDALRTEGTVTGEVGDLGIVALIECVVSARPDVRLTVEDDADVFDVDIADANQIAVTRTAADGTFTRAERALMQLIGVTQGRFHVRKRSGSLRSPVQTPLKSALHAAVSEISAMIDAVSSERVEQVTRLSFDDELLASRLKDAAGFGRMVSALRALGLSPKQVLLDGVFSSGELSACLTLLARQAVITGLWGPEDQDLLATSTRLYMPRPVPSLPPAARAEPAPVTKASPPRAAPQAAAPLPAAAVEASSALEPLAAVELLPSAAEPSPAAEPPKAAAEPPSAAAEPPKAAAEPPSAAAEPRLDAATEQLPGEAAKVAAESTPTEPESAKTPDPEILPPAAKHAQAATLAEPLPSSSDEQEATFESDPEAAFAQEANPELAAEIALARRRRRDGLLLGATLAASAVLGYVGALQIETHPALFGRDQPIGTRGLEAPLMAASPRSETSVRSGLDPSVGLGTVLPYIDTTRGVPVGSDEGLVIFEYVGPLPTPNVEIDGRVLGAPPLSVALAATPHQLKLWFAGEPTLRTLSVRAGETRVITLPLLNP